MIIWHIDLLWAFMLLGVALWTTGCLVFNPVLTSIRVMGLGLAYGALVWMLVTLPWLDAVVTWCLFATFGGVVSFAYELWARHHYRARGRAPRPLVALQGFVLWPTMIPDAVEGVLVDAGVLPGAMRTGEHDGFD